MNYKIVALLEVEDIVRIIKSMRIRLYGNNIIKIILNWKPGENRPKERPRPR